MLKQKKWLIATIIVVLSFFIYSNIGDQLSSEHLLSNSTELEVTNDVYTNSIITEELNTQESNTQENITKENTKQVSSLKVVYGNDYYSKDEVATYLHTYEELPPNYITKSEANALGWDADKGNLWDVSYGSVIGGDRFGNREGLLPKKEGRTYYECDVNYEGGFRNAMRLVFSNDGLIYYTEDHYASFEPLFP
jgi:guanyl-specific ribonuclease Sa